MIFWKVLFEALYFKGSYNVSSGGKTHWRPVVIGSSGSVGPWDCLTFSRVPSHHGLDYSACCPPTQMCKRKKRSRKAKATTVPITAPWCGVLDSASMHKALKSTPSTGERGVGRRKERERGAGRWLSSRVLTTKPDNLTVNPRIYMVEGENQQPQTVLWPLHTLWRAHAHMHTTQSESVSGIFVLLCWGRKEGKKNKDVEKKEKEESLKSLLETRSLYS